MATLKPHRARGTTPTSTQNPNLLGRQQFCTSIRTRRCLSSLSPSVASISQDAVMNVVHISSTWEALRPYPESGCHHSYTSFELIGIVALMMAYFLSAHGPCGSGFHQEGRKSSNFTSLSAHVDRDHFTGRGTRRTVSVAFLRELLPPKPSLWALPVRIPTKRRDIMVML